RRTSPRPVTASTKSSMRNSRSTGTAASSGSRPRSSAMSGHIQFTHGRQLSSPSRSSASCPAPTAFRPTAGATSPRRLRPYLYRSLSKDRSPYLTVIENIDHHGANISLNPAVFELYLPSSPIGSKHIAFLEAKIPSQLSQQPPAASPITSRSPSDAGKSAARSAHSRSASRSPSS